MERSLPHGRPDTRPVTALTPNSAKQFILDNTALMAPPHVPELFGPIAAVTYLLPEPEIVHGGLHEFSEHALKGSRECRAKAQEMEVLVFEAYRENGELFVDVAVGDVIEPRMLPAGVALIAHLRPHRNPRDVIYHPTTPVSFI